MYLLTLGRRRKVSVVYTESQEPPRGVDAVIEACDKRPLYTYNKFIRIKSMEHPAEYPLNERQMEQVQEYKEMLQKSLLDDFVGSRTSN